MQALVGAVLVLAGSVLIGTGLIADAVQRGANYGTFGYWLGGFLSVVGAVIMILPGLKRAWDAIPIDDKSSRKG